jgi:hypothetical protein
MLFALKRSPFEAVIAAVSLVLWPQDPALPRERSRTWQRAGNVFDEGGYGDSLHFRRSAITAVREGVDHAWRARLLRRRAHPQRRVLRESTGQF